MDLKTTIPHKRNTKLLVNGEIFEIDGEGILQGVPEEAAEKLLQNDSWRPYTPDGVPEKPVEKPKIEKSKMALIGVGGEKHEKPEESETEESEDEDDGKQMLDPPIPDPDTDEEWADPHEDFSREWLEACADAYEVKYNKRTNNEKLVEKIKKAMYS